MDTKALHALSYGLYIITSKKEKSFNGQIANAVIQISNDPPSIAVSINKQNLTHEFIRESGLFNVSVLSQEVPMSLIGHFGFKSGREIDKFSEIDYKLGKNGVPYLEDNVLSVLEVKVISQNDAGSHTIFLGHLTDARVVAKGEPMTYAYYHKIKKGSAPKTAPITNNEKEGLWVYNYLCTICGYVYDPEVGDPEIDVSPGTSFESLPEDWVCPICEAEKEAFEKQ